MPLWQQACAEPNKLPDRAVYLAQQMSGAAAVMAPGAHHPGMVIAEPVPGAKPLALPPELAALRASGAIGQQVGKLSPEVRFRAVRGSECVSVVGASITFSASRCCIEPVMLSNQSLHPVNASFQTPEAAFNNVGVSCAREVCELHPKDLFSEVYNI